jgi:hypothetical protein
MAIRCNPQNLLVNWYRDFVQVVKRPGCEVNHSPPSSAEVKNGWSYTSTIHECIHCLDQANFNFTLIKMNAGCNALSLWLFNISIKVSAEIQLTDFFCVTIEA